MSDPQHFGLGELGQRVQAMSDPANPPKSSPSESAPADPRLRPYQGAPLPIGSLPSRGPLPSYEPQNDLRTPPPAAPAKPQTSPFPSNAAPFSGPPSAAPTGPAFAQASPRPFEPAHKSPPASAWEQVAIPAQPGPAQPGPTQPGPAQTSAATTPQAPEAPAPPASQLSGNPASGDPPRSGFQRAMDAVRSAIPVVQKLLPLIDGNFATAMSALMAPQNHPTPHVQVDLEPVERGLAEVSKSNRELRTQVQEQGTTLKRVEDQLERVREATDRNTLEQQELVEDLRAVGSRISTLAVIGVILLLISLGLNGYLIFELQHILR